MKKLSNGEKSTLGNYRDLCIDTFGANSPAVKYLNERIEKQGANQEVIADESQMIELLANVHFKKPETQKV